MELLTEVSKTELPYALVHITTPSHTTLTHSLTHSLTHHPLTPPSHTTLTRTLAHTLSHTLTHALTHTTLTHTLTYTLTHTCPRSRRGGPPLRDKRGPNGRGGARNDPRD